MIAVLVMLGVAAAMIFGGPLAVGLRPWSLRRPRLALFCWLAVFAIGLLALVLSAGFSVALAVDANSGAGGAVPSTLAVLGAWLTLGLIGAAGSLALTCAEPLAAGRSATAARLDLLALVAAEHTTSIRGVRIVTVDFPEPVACAVRSPVETIIVSSALAQQLSPRASRSVIEHERAHLRGRHDVLLGVAALQRACLPRFFGARALERAIHLLVEVIADDAAARVCGSAAVVEAIVALDRIQPNEGARLRAHRLESVAAHAVRPRSGGDTRVEYAND